MSDKEDRMGFVVSGSVMDKPDSPPVVLDGVEITGVMVEYER